MNIVNLILRLLHRFSAFESNEYEKLKADALAWYSDINLENKDLPAWKLKFKQLSESWMVRGLCGILFIYLVRKIQDWMNPRQDEDTEDDED